MNMKKTFPALLAAFVITLCMGASILLIGGNALFNGNGISISNSRDAAAAQAGYSDQAAQVKDLQAQVAQYQTRETQYQTQLDQAAQQIQNDNVRLQQYQQLLNVLQQRRIITISSDGRIFLNQ
jgi:multidrug efflux pump subunit AcrA (membrane-fusion protein)